MNEETMNVPSRAGKGVSWCFSRLLLGLLSLVVFLLSEIVPVWTSRTEHALATVGETVYYGFPIPTRSIATGGSSFDGMLVAGALDLVFWAGVVAFADLRYMQGKQGAPVTWQGFFRNWLSVCGGIVALALLVATIVITVS